MEKKGKTVLASFRIKRDIYEKAKAFLRSNEKINFSTLVNIALNEIFESRCLIGTEFDIYIEKDIFVKMFGLQKLKDLIKDEKAKEIELSRNKKMIALNEEVYKKLLKEEILNVFLNGFLKDDD